MRLLARVFAILLTVGLAAGPIHAADARPRLSLNSKVWPPFYLDDPKEPGFAHEVLDSCLSSLGYDTMFREIPLETMFSSLRSGLLDAHVLSRDPSREGFVTFGKEPIFTGSYRPVVRAGSGIAIRSLSDFDKLRIGHLKGVRYAPAYHDYVLKRIEAGTVVQADENDQLLRMLLDGKIDVFVSLSATTRWLAKSMGASDKIEVLPFDVKSSTYYMAVSQKSAHIADKPAFLDAFDGCLKRMRKDGSYAKLEAKYGL
jgi:ABC-type amino acid transport substrate-binding protein